MIAGLPLAPRHWDVGGKCLARRDRGFQISAFAERTTMTTSSCIFCAIAAGRAPAEILAQDDAAVAFMDNRPAALGHTLVVPRQHFAAIWEMDEAAGLAVMRLTVRVARALRAALRPDGLSVMQNNGRAAGQEVSHIHWHLVPRWYGDGLRLVRGPAVPPAEPLSAVARRVRAAL
jgi:histidine triad (HIT) family protein